MTRYDRDVAKRVHAEDFAQIFNVVPDDKYTKDVCYAQLMLFMQQVPSLGESAVFEFLRRLVVSELLGNPDLHMKNAGVYYPDGVNPVLPPAYDIVSHYVLNRTRGHALHILPREAEAQQLEDQKKSLPESHYLLVARPGTMRALGKLIGIAEKRLSAVVDEVVRKAAQLWPDAIRESPMTSTQKRLLLDYFESHPAVEAIRRREHRKAASQPAETSGSPCRAGGAGLCAGLRTSRAPRRRLQPHRRRHGRPVQRRRRRTVPAPPLRVAGSPDSGLVYWRDDRRLRHATARRAAQ